MGFSTYLEQAVLNEVFGAVAFTPPATVYVGLSTTTISNSAAPTEPTGAGYARVAVANNATNWPAATGNSPATKANGGPVTFPGATGSWGTVVDVFIADAATGGNILGFGHLGASQAVSSGDTLSFGAGELTIPLN